MIVRVVDVCDVDPLQPETLEALHQRAAGGVATEVEHRLESFRDVPHAVGQLLGRDRVLP